MSEKFKSIKATRYDKEIKSIMDTEISIVESPMSSQEFDNNGNILHSISWGSGNMLSEKFIYEYQDNRLIKQLTYADEHELAETEYYEYDSKGSLTKTILEYLDGSQDFINHVYNDNNQLISSITIDDEGDDGQQEFWDYDGENLIQYRLIDDFGNLEEEQKMTYNTSNQLIEKSIINNLNETNFSWKYEYNKEGKLVLESRFKSNGKPIEEISYSYDDKGLLIQEKTENAKDTIIKNMQYDISENEIYAVLHNEDDETTIYEIWRAFDDSSNQKSNKVLVYGNGEGNSSEYEVKYEYEFY